MVERKFQDGKQIYTITGRIHSDNAEEVRALIMEQFAADCDTILDLSELEYVSSAGLRVFLSLQKKMEKGRKIVLANVNSVVKEILDVTGFSDFFTVTKGLREISIDGCECIGRGGCGECYRLDSETIVKLYYDYIADEEIEREKKYSKEAFVAGIPTAISFDVVMCKGRKGVVYEMLDAKTLSASVVEHPEQLEKIGKEYAKLCKLIHTTKGNEKEFQKATQVYRELLPKMQLLSEKGREKVKKLLDKLDGYDTYIHGDINPNNVMVVEDELMLIDMGAFAIGCPMLDIAGLAFTFEYCATAQEDEVEPFTKMTGRQQRTLWNVFLQEYFRADNLEDAKKKHPDAALIQACVMLKVLQCHLLYAESFSEEWNERAVKDVTEFFC